jgi:hypothetical protein
MSPHKPNPAPRKIEVDLSAILVRPRKPESTEVGHWPEFGTVFHQPIGPSIDASDVRIGPFTWTNITFVVGSCLIALLCTVFFSDNFESARRRANLKHVVSPRPELDSTTAGDFCLEPAQLVSGMQLDHAKIPGFDEKGADINPSPVLPTLQPTPELQPLASSPNTSRIADIASASNSSSPRSDSAARDSVSRATSSRSITASRGGRSISVRSGTTRISRHSRKSMISSRTRSLSDRQNLRRSLTNGGASKSMPQTARQTVRSVAIDNHHGHGPAAEIQTATARTQMSMHSMGQGSVLTQSGGAMNCMEVESGMLAQPAMGGVTGNGLGGAGNRGGNSRR